MKPSDPIVVLRFSPSAAAPPRRTSRFWLVLGLVALTLVALVALALEAAP